MRPVQSLLLLLAAMLAVLMSNGCSPDGGRLLSELSPTATTVTASGNGSPILVSYTISRPASVSSYLLAQSGETLYLSRDEKRPVAGEYAISFNGSYAPDPASDERRIAPTGSYQLVVDARDERSSAQATTRIQVMEADTKPPAVQNLTLYPDSLSPNEDGIDDTLKITFHTAKLATVSVYLVAESGKRHLLERQDRAQLGEHSITWDGQVNSQLLPSGSYRFVVEARDQAGNVSIAEKQLRIDSSSVPEARILSVNFEPRSLLFGGTVKATIRLKNTGNTVLRTQGPDPGYTYDSQEGFSTIEEGAFRDQRGLWRVGVDWAGAPGASGSRYPYRWGFGKDLQPGEEVTVVGYIRMDHKYPRIWLHAGIVQEQVRYWDNEVGQTVIETGY